MAATNLQVASHSPSNPGIRFSKSRSRNGSLRVGYRGVMAVLNVKQECVLAIDVGTGGTKASLVSSAGKVLVSGFAPHSAPTQSTLGGPLSMEQDQEMWWLATIQAVESCISCAKFQALGIDLSNVRALAVTGQMQDIVIVPKATSAFRSPAILYSDARAVLEVNEIAELVGGSSHLAAITGSLQGASSVLAKLRWLDKHMEDAVHSCEYLLFGGHDYVTWKLSGAHVTDVTTASTTGLTDSSFQYAENLMKKVGLEHWINKLPEIFLSDAPCGEVTATASGELGFPDLQGLPVLHSCGDAGTCTLGAGAADPGHSYAYLGTSGWVAGTFPWRNSTGVVSWMQYSLDSTSGVFTLGHPNPSFVFKTGSIMTAGGNLAWAAENLVYPGRGSPSLDEINKLAATAPLACDGLLYLPFLNGERCPVDNPNYRAGFIGISAVTRPAELFRAVMEGVAFAMRSAREAMAGEQLDGRTCAPLRLVGGGARSPVWPLIMAGIFGQTVEVLEDAQDVGVKGAAVLAGKWLGWHSSLCPGGDWLNVKHSYEPPLSDVEAYNDLYLAYGEACKNLENVFNKLSRYKNRGA